MDMKIFLLKNKYLRIVVESKYKRMFIGSIMVGIFIISSFFFESYSSYKSEMKLAETQASNLSQVLESNIANSFKKIDLVLQELQDIFQNENDLSVHTKKFNELLLKHKKRLPEVLSFKAVDENGEFVADDLGVLSTKNLKDRDYYTKMKNDNIDQIIISKPVISKTTGLLVVVLSRPIMSITGKFRGLILATIPLTHYQKIFSNINVGEKGTITLMDLDGYFYARKPWVDKFSGKKVKLKERPLHFLRSSEISDHYQSEASTDGIERTYAARKMGNYPFAVFVGLSVDELLGPWKIRIITHTIFIIIVFFISGFFLINFLYSLEELEEQRKQTIQSAKLSSLGEMASGIAHEINNPLTIISSYARSLKRTNSENENDPKINEAADKIVITVNRIAKIIKGLQSFARDSFNDAIVPTSVKKIIESTLELCHEKLKDNSIELKINTFIDFEVDCREVQITQVLVNLLNNSRDAIEGPSKWIKIEVIESAAEVILIISDSGKKISKEVADKIMQPFFTTKEIGKGLGLGLSISKGIIEGHNGKFYLDMNAVHTTFVIKLPKVISGRLS